MERLRREELRNIDGYRAIAMLCGRANYRTGPRAPKPTSGLIEQQHWFLLAAKREQGACSAHPPRELVDDQSAHVE